MLGEHTMSIYFRIFIGLTLILLFEVADAAQAQMLQNDQIMVVYETPLESAAGEVMGLYPKLRQELEEFFSWSLDIRPQVVLVKNTETFQKLSRNKLFVAYAVPDKNLIVIDYSRMNIHPFTLDTTFKHELCHLMLHRYITNHNLPKWLDEGVCQWVSDGIGEIFLNNNWSGLDAAVMAGRTIPLKRLTDNFPRDNASLMLAYEQSKGVVNFVDRQYGYHAIMEILDLLKNGETVETAVMSGLGISLRQLEKDWLDHLESTPRWLVFMASHIYAIIFFLAAVLTFFGFIRHMRRRKRIYQEWEDEDP
jgi:hypothetical protein